MAAETCNDSIRLRKPGNEGYWSLKGFFFTGFFFFSYRMFDQEWN